VKRSGQPPRSTACENVDQVKEPVYKHGRITIQETADMLEITYERVPSIFKDNLNMHQTATKFMHHLLNEIQT
jgi:hypothetical protein